MEMSGSILVGRKSCLIHLPYHMMQVKLLSREITLMSTSKLIMCMMECKLIQQGNQNNRHPPSQVTTQATQVWTQRKAIKHKHLLWVLSMSTEVAWKAFATLLREVSLVFSVSQGDTGFLKRLGQVFPSRYTVDSLLMDTSTRWTPL